MSQDTIAFLFICVAIAVLIWILSVFYSIPPTYIAFGTLGMGLSIGIYKLVELALNSLGLAFDSLAKLVWRNITNLYKQSKKRLYRIIISIYLIWLLILMLAGVSESFAILAGGPLIVATVGAILYHWSKNGV